jgi:transketolase C-terminal domain/subunit
VYGGVGSIVSNVLAEERIDREIHKIALPDLYLEAGTLGTLQDMYGVSQKAVSRTFRKVLMKEA